jgi:hypothetical protein
MPKRVGSVLKRGGLIARMLDRLREAMSGPGPTR